MKIVKRVGERLLPRWIRAELRPVLVFTGAGAALWAGSCELVRRGWAALDEQLGTREKLGAVAAGVYVAGYSCSHAPHAAVFAVPGAVLAWCVAAWWIAPPADPAPAEPPAPDAAEAFTRWLLDLIGDRSGIHLRELYPAMRKLPGHEDRDNLQLRAALNTLGVPVTRSLRLDGVAGRSGVARGDLEALLPSSGDFPEESDGDAGQPVDSPAGEQPGERLESA